MPEIITLTKPSSKYKFFIPGTQFVGSGNAKDYSGNGNDAVISSATTDAATWANNKYITTGAGTGLGVSVPLAGSSFDLATQSVIIHGVCNVATPAGVENIIGNGDNASAQGVYLRIGTTGKMRPVLNASGGVVAGLADSTGTLCDGTDHSFAIAIDGVVKSVFTYIDGFLDHSYLTAFIGGTPSIADQFCIGMAASATPSTTTSYAGKWKGLGELVFTGGLPLNISAIAQRLSANPLQALSDSEIQF